MNGDTRLDALGWNHVYSGKVRDLYRSDAHRGRMLVVATDRVSAFDYVLEPAIPGKGAILTRLSLWWFERLGIPNHLAAGHPALGDHLPEDIVERAMLVRELDMLPVECVVRGYLVGSGWREYRASGTVCGIDVRAGLREGDRIPEPIFTPTTKAPLGEHDEHIDFAETTRLVGEADAAELRDRSLAAYATASGIAAARGLILADSKFEFGRDRETGGIVIADEVFTPDSSRYWDAATYTAGGRDRLASFDKQIVRDWLAANWDRTGTPPALPAEVVERTAARYRELAARIEG